MRRQTLAPPRPAVELPAANEGATPAVAHVRLGPPGPARSIPRRLFDPVAGWFRRTERGSSLFLSHHVFSRVPGLPALYDATLARHLTVADVEIGLPGLPSAWEGAGILLITDLHAGPFLSVRGLRDAWARLATLKPDVVLLGGDFITTGLGEIVAHVDTLRSIRAPNGVFGVLGNHDHYGEDPATLVDFLESCGVRILQNDSAVLERDGGRLELCGIDDWNAGQPDLDRALAGVRPADGPVLLLSHNPDAFFEAARRGVALTLSGHTHGGQVRLPGLPVLVRMSRYRLDEGRFASAGSEIVVSRGLGVSGLPLRVGCPPEAVFVRLRGDRRGAVDDVRADVEDSRPA